MGMDNASQHRQPVDLAKIGVIVIAEQTSISSLLTEQLRALKIGFVHSFADGDEAIDRLSISPNVEAGVLIMEWDGADDAKMLKRLRRISSRPIQELPVIAVMVRADVEKVMMARDSGANAVLALPISAAQLLDKLAWALSAEIPFVRSHNYVGPDRRRFRGLEYIGKERRKDQANDSENAPG